MMHVVVGLFCVALGIWGIFDEWYYVLDFLKGAGSLLLVVGGLLAMVAGTLGRAAAAPDASADPSE
jgi:uncharacterized membrane protein